MLIGCWVIVYPLWWEKRIGAEVASIVEAEHYMNTLYLEKRRGPWKVHSERAARLAYKMLRGRRGDSIAVDGLVCRLHRDRLAGDYRLRSI